MGKGSYDEIDNTTDPNDFYRFTIGVIAAQVIGLIMIILVCVWMGSFHNGFGWNPEIVFNYHPLFMTLGLIFLYGDAILLYRVLRHMPKIQVKIMHATVQVGAFIFSAIALKAVFDSHNKATKPIPNLYSLHSWIGLLTVIFFCGQWIGGFVSFLFPKLSDGLRRLYLPHHKYWGLAIFGMACGTALMGITEKAIFSVSNYSQLPGEGVLLNFFGLTIVTFCILVIYLVTKYEYHRPPEHQN